MYSAFGVDHGDVVSKNAKAEIMRLGLRRPTGPMAPGREYFLHNRAYARQLGHKAGKPNPGGKQDIGSGNKTAANYSLSEYAVGRGGTAGKVPGLKGSGRLPA
jgi:hypothetical protein